MGQALYRKYRSKNLGEIVGQEHVTQALKTALKDGHISHAYLFTGPRGTGKTSIARILAHEINGLPYTDDVTHLDIIEIDAASNRRIDEIRDLRDRVSIAPTSAKFKVYIIDEVHMLTREAFNALLKTLEEPPAHVVFILATTEAHKLPETITSRTQRFTFRPVDQAKVIGHLNKIAKHEKIGIDDEALGLIAEHSGGSLRDSLSLLDQVRNIGQKITLADIEQTLGLAPRQLIEELINNTEQGNVSELVQLLQRMSEQGYEPAMIAKQAGQLWRQRLLQEQSSLATGQVLRILEQLINVPASASPQTLLEIILLQGSGVNSTAAAPSTSAETSATPPSSTSVTQVTPHPHRAKSAPESKVDPTPIRTEPLAAPAASDAPRAPIDTELWPAVLNAIKKDYNTLYGIARMAEPHFDGKKLLLDLQFAFHQKRLNEARNRKIITDVLHQLTGKEIEVHCELNVKARPAPSAASAPDGNPLETVSNIFGGAELLES